MSQRNVEALIGKLVTDEGFRRRFGDRPADVLRELVASGWELTAAEQRALTSCNLGVVERCSRAVDPRLLKVELRRADESGPGGTDPSKESPSSPSSCPTDDLWLPNPLPEETKS